MCPAGDAPTAVGEENTRTCTQYDSTYGHVDCSPTLTFPGRSSSTVELTIDCSAAPLCRVLDRFIFRGTTAIFRRLEFLNLVGRGDYGGAITADGASVSVIRCAFERATSGFGSIAAWGGGTALHVILTSFVGCNAEYSGGGITLQSGITRVTLSGLTFRDNTAGVTTSAPAVYWDNHDSIGDHTQQLGTRDYTDDEANAAFGPCASATDCNSRGTCTTATGLCDCGDRYSGGQCEIEPLPCCSDAGCNYDRFGAQQADNSCEDGCSGFCDCEC